MTIVDAKLIRNKFYLWRTPKYVSFYFYWQQLNLTFKATNAASLLKLLWHVISTIGTVAMTSITIFIHQRGHFDCQVYSCACTLVQSDFEESKKLEVETNFHSVWFCDSGLMIGWTNTLFFELDTHIFKLFNVFKVCKSHAFSMFLYDLMHDPEKTDYFTLMAQKTRVAPK